MAADLQISNMEEGIGEKTIVLKNIDFLFFKIEDFNQHIENYFGLSVNAHYISLLLLCGILIILPILYLFQKPQNAALKSPKALFLYTLTPLLAVVSFTSIHLYFCMIVLYGDMMQLNLRLWFYGGLAVVYCVNAFVFSQRSSGITHPPILYIFMLFSTMIVTALIFMLSMGIIYNPGY